MSEINDGGNAFPSIDGEGTVFFGMSLRDYFAAGASENDIANHRYKLYHSGGCIEEPTREQCRYAYADAMIAEREKLEGGFYQMVERGGFDISPCRNCGASVVCIPEGLALCKTCAAKGGEA